MSRSPSPTPSESFSQDNNAWGLVLGQLIEGDVSFEVMVQDDYIELRCLSSDQLMELKNKLEELFLCPNIIQHKLPYQLHAVNTEQSSHSELSVTIQPHLAMPQPPKASEAFGIIQNMFPAMKVDSGINMSLAEVFNSESIGDVAMILSNPISSESLSFWQKYLPQFIDRASKTSLYQLQLMYLPQVVGAADDDTTDFFISSELLQKCIYLAEISEKTHVVFDAHLLYCLLFPPAVTLQPMPSEAEEGVACYSLRVYKKHLTLFLAQALPKQVLFHSIPGEDAYQPVLLPSIFKSATDTRVYLLLDTTISMGDVFTAYKNQVKQFIDKLSGFFSSDQDAVFVIPFNQEVLPQDLYDSDHAKVFYLARDGQTARCKDYIQDLTCEGCTRLHGAINDLRARDAFTQHSEQNRVLVLFTDGCSNRGAETIMPIQGGSLFQSYVMGLGDSYDKRLCNAIASQTDGKHIHLKEMSDFETVHQYLKRICQSRVLRKFFEQLVSVYSDPVVLADVRISAEGIFTLDGEQYQLSEGALRRDVVRVEPQQDMVGLGASSDAFASTVSSGASSDADPFASTVSSAASSDADPFASDGDDGDNPRQEARHNVVYDWAVGLLMRAILRFCSRPVEEQFATMIVIIGVLSMGYNETEFFSGASDKRYFGHLFGGEKGDAAQEGGTKAYTP